MFCLFFSFPIPFRKKSERHRYKSTDIGAFVSFISTNSLNVLRAIDTLLSLWLFWEMAQMVIISTSDAYICYRQWNTTFFAMKSMLIGIFIFIVYLYRDTLYYRDIRIPNEMTQRLFLVSQQSLKHACIHIKI